MVDNTASAAVPSVSDEGQASPMEQRFTRWFIALVPLAVSCFYLWSVLTLPRLAREPIISPHTWPTMVAILMVVSALVLTWAAVTQRWGVLARAGGTEIGSWRDVLVTLGIAIVFVIVVEPLGYVVSVFLLVLSLTLLVSPAKWKRNLIAAALFAILSSALFSGLLGVRLPAGVVPLPWL